MSLPRHPRSLADMGFYHILSRGNNKNKIFHCQQDYSYFLKVLKRYLDKFQINIFHYCLMPNHIHLLVQAQVGNHLPKFMQGMDSDTGIAFTSYYNLALQRNFGI